MRISTFHFQNNLLQGLLDQQGNIDNLQLQVLTGKRIVSPSDDPVASTRVNSVEVFNIKIESLLTNSTYATSRLQLEENTLTSVTDKMRRVKELYIQGSNETLNNGDRKLIASELQVMLDELVGLANTKDSNGEFIFSGFQSKTKAFVNNNNTYIFQGDAGQRFLDVGLNTSIAITDSGYDIFENVAMGNGRFVTNDGPTTNTGTGIISIGEVTDNNAYVRDTYTISFVTNSLGELAYQVVGASSGQVIPPLPAASPANAPAYVEGGAINFNGHQIEIKGTPNIGDDFQVTPSSSQNIFTSLQNMINILNVDINNDVESANFHNIIDRNMASFEQGLQTVLEKVSQIGSRESVVESEKNLLEDIKVQNAASMSKLQDANLTEVISKLTQVIQQMEISQRVFAEIGSISLFDRLNFR